MIITNTQKETKTQKINGVVMSHDSFEKSVSTIGFAVLTQFAIKWGVIGFLGWYLISTINQWIATAVN